MKIAFSNNNSYRDHIPPPQLHLRKPGVPCLGSSFRSWESCDTSFLSLKARRQPLLCNRNCSLHLPYLYCPQPPNRQTLHCRYSASRLIPYLQQPPSYYCCSYSQHLINSPPRTGSPPASAPHRRLSMPRLHRQRYRRASVRSSGSNRWH